MIEPAAQKRWLESLSLLSCYIKQILSISPQSCKCLCKGLARNTWSVPSDIKRTVQFTIAASHQIYNIRNRSVSTQEKKDYKSEKRIFYCLTYSVDLDSFKCYHLREKVRNSVTKLLLWSTKFIVIQETEIHKWGHWSMRLRVWRSLTSYFCDVISQSVTCPAPLRWPNLASCIQHHIILIYYFTLTKCLQAWAI